MTVESSSRLAPELLASLERLLGSRLNVTHAVRDHHSRGEAHRTSGAPDAVVYPTSTEEVSAIAKLCSAYRIPMVPFGAGTSLEGHVAAVEGGLTVDFSELNRVLRVSAEDLD